MKNGLDIYPYGIKLNSYVYKIHNTLFQTQSSLILLRDYLPRLKIENHRWA